jgi:sugar lactone lactonase YvrE
MTTGSSTGQKAVRVGQGKFAFDAHANWGRIPEGFRVREAVGLAVDSMDRLFLFTREETPVLIFSPDGAFLGSWGRGLFIRPHGLVIGPDDTVYCTDDKGQRVQRFSPEGQLLQSFGTPGQASDTGVKNMDYRTIERAAGPFNLPTNVALAPQGDVYVSDGYGNARVHRFAADGRLLHSWGQPGSGPGQFQVPHGVAVARDGTVFVSDRENSRIQLFSPDGRYLEQWTDVARPCKVAFDGEGNVFVAELGFRAGMFVGNVPPAKPAGSRVGVFTRGGELICRWGGGDHVGSPGDFHAAHDLVLDSRGDLYVGEVRPGMYGGGASPPPAAVPPPGTPVLQKFVRV